MRYEFRTADGRTCCRSDRFDMLCVKCQAKAKADVYENPPDPYAHALAARSGSALRDKPRLNGDPFGMHPDPYAAALAKRKEQQR